ncbi:MAG TPA: hypothetical protein PLF61_02820 [Candidatus Goldiibacteriota bacterium]|nr:hypothetical protein [Candidatus Goldiibacteriota bacterium]
MKKFMFFFFVIFVLSVNLFADYVESKEDKDNGDDEEYIIVYDVFKHKETASYIYLGIAGLSLGMGTGILANAGNNQFLFGLAVQNIVWGIGEGCAYLYEKNWAYKEPDEEKARQEFVSSSAFHLIFDGVAIVAGGLMLGFGDESIKGHGTGILIQGLILSLFDFSNFFIAKNPETVNARGVE